jgi:DNA-binding IclR family transcriptional regulator
MKRSTSLLRAQDRLSGSAPNSQTLVRGLDVLEMVALGPLALPALADRLGLARSTAHRLATALLERRYLTLMPREGYVLGPKLLELGSLAQEQTALLRVARAHMEKLAAESLDTVHLTICESGAALLLERIQGHRRLLPSLRVGERTCLTRCVGGRALLIDGTEGEWRTMFAQDCGSERAVVAESDDVLADFLIAMSEAADRGYAFDADDSADPLRTVAAPVRAADGAIVAALGLSTAAQYLDENGLAASGRAVRAAADAISADLGRPDNRNGPAASDTARRDDAHGSPGENARHAPLPPLEAGEPRVHDPKSNGSSHAGGGHRGGAYEA